MTETIASIIAAHRSGTISPEQTVARSFERIRQWGDPAIFISLRAEADALAEARALASCDGAAQRPLYGVPVAVKDNIDVQGLATTAACPAFAYQPRRDATAVARLRRAGAIVIGKTNLDQFATGLVGVRSPYGVPRNPFDPTLIPGGSSSGSAVAVAAGLVPLAMGTDTAGSGRVPAGLNNIVGLKPSLGLVSTAGIVPACRTLDCVSLFALTVDDAFTALKAMAGFDPTDPLSRAVQLGRLEEVPAGLRVGVPRRADRDFQDDPAAEAAFEDACAVLGRLGARVAEIDFTPFFATARLLYEGPWVAERMAAVGDFVASHPDDVHPVTRAIILSGAKPSGVDVFRALHRLGELRRDVVEIFGGIDALMVPTVPAVRTVEAVSADPVQLNSDLGTYTNFVNLLDLAGLAVPAAMADNGIPFGVTFLMPGGSDARLASLGRAFAAQTGLSLGALATAPPALPALDRDLTGDEIAVGVVGAHLSGMPLNRELRAFGARLLQQTVTAPEYRLFALAATEPPRPGLLRVAPDIGAAVEIEVWAMAPEAFGRFVASIQPPLTIGPVILADGRIVNGFLVEAVATHDARDISTFGGWRAFINDVGVQPASP